MYYFMYLDFFCILYNNNIDYIILIICFIDVKLVFFFNSWIKDDVEREKLI